MQLRRLPPPRLDSSCMAKPALPSFFKLIHSSFAGRTLCAALGATHSQAEPSTKSIDAISPPALCPDCEPRQSRLQPLPCARRGPRRREGHPHAGDWSSLGMAPSRHVSHSIVSITRRRPLVFAPHQRSGTTQSRGTRNAGGAGCRRRAARAQSTRAAWCGRRRARRRS